MRRPRRYVLLHLGKQCQNRRGDLNPRLYPNLKRNTLWSLEMKQGAKFVLIMGVEKLEAAISVVGPPSLVFNLRRCVHNMYKDRDTNQEQLGMKSDILQQKVFLDRSSSESRYGVRLRTLPLVAQCKDSTERSNGAHISGALELY